MYPRGSPRSVFADMPPITRMAKAHDFLVVSFLRPADATCLRATCLTWRERVDDVKALRVYTKLLMAKVCRLLATLNVNLSAFWTEFRLSGCSFDPSDMISDDAFVFNTPTRESHARMVRFMRACVQGDVQGYDFEPGQLQPTTITAYILKIRSARLVDSYRSHAALCRAHGKRNIEIYAVHTRPKRDMYCDGSHLVYECGMFCILPDYPGVYGEILPLDYLLKQ